MNDLLTQLLDRRDLSAEQAEGLVVALGRGEVEPAVAGALLAALRAKGECGAEVAGFARGLRSLARPTAARALGGDRAVDIVGTGGDASRAVNLSTGAALLAAASGARVIKHGNRSISSLCGSADVLGALGMKVPMSDAEAAACLTRSGFTFLFAPEYHPAFAHIGPVRRALGVRTIFNVMGPLTNPAGVRFGVLGAYSEQAARLMAVALATMPIERYFVVHGRNGWDEPTPCAEFTLWDVRPGEVHEEVRDARGASGVEACDEEALRGGTAEENARALRAALTERAGPVREALVLGAGLALEVTGLSGSMSEGIERARGAIADGSAGRVLGALGGTGGTGGTGGGG
jgi:anthranilate phosphoribosyltransferase